MKKIAPLAFTMLGLLSTSASAELAGIGLPDPINHFPSWIKDTNNVSLQLCLDGDGDTGMCLYDAVDPAFPFSVTTGFGGEAFYSTADARLNMPNGRRASLVQATEAAYLNGDPVDGDQMVFGRIRFRIDTPAAGTYRVFHPYLKFPACQPEVFVVPAGGNRTINVTRDIGGGAPFNLILGANVEVGPFLKWDPAIAPQAPLGYLGNPNVNHAITGSKCNTNFFRIEGPNINGAGVNFIQTNLFSVSGKIFDAANTPAAVVIDRATYARTAAGATTLNVFASSASIANLSLSTVLGLPAGPMISDLNGSFFAQRSAVAVPPATVTVTATTPNPAVPATVTTLPVADSIDVDPAVYTAAAQTLAVTARSSDLSSPAPTLTAKVGTRTQVMTRDLAGVYTTTFANVVAPLTAVTVTSSKGGIDSEAIRN
jgi:hypothetical protein